MGKGDAAMGYLVQSGNGRAIGLLLLGLFVVLFAFYWPWLIGSSSFFRNDLTAFWHPLVMFNADALRTGRLPLWNPYLGCGIPQIAILTPGVFFPPNWLFPWLGFNSSLALILVAHQAVAGLGMFLLVTDAGWGLAPAFLAAITIALSGYFFSLQTSYALLCTAAWFPLCLWCTRDLLKASGAHFDAGAMPRIALVPVVRFISTALCIFMFVTAGVPEIFLPGLLLLILYVLLHLSKDGRAARTQFATACGAFGAGCLLAMPALLPAAQWTQLSQRSSGLRLNEVFTWSAGWYELLGLFVPQPFGDVMRVDNRFLRLFIPPPVQGPYFASSYVGAITATLAWYGCFAAFWRRRPWILALLALSVMAAMGGNTPVAPFLLQSWHVAPFRYPVKLMFFVVLCLVLLSAAGLKTVLTTPQAVRKPNWIAIAFWLLVVGAAFFLTASPASFENVAPFRHPDVSLGTAAAAAWRIGRCAMQAAALGLVVCVFCELVRREKLRPKFFAAAIVILQAGLLLASAFACQRFTGPADYYNQESTLEQRLRRLNGGTTNGLRVAVIQADMRPPGNILDVRNRTLGLHEYMRSMLIPLSNVDYKIASTITFVVGQTKDMDRFAWDTLEAHSRGDDVPLARFCQLSSTQFIYTPLRLVAPDGKLLGELPTLDPRFFALADEDQPLNIRIYKVNKPMPRCYFANGAKWGSPHEAVVGFICHATEGGFDPNLSTILETDGNASIPIPQNFTAAPSRIDVLQEDNQSIGLHTSNPNGNFLVFTTQYYPGWQAQVDGKSAAIYRANALVQAVWVPPGEHTVEFTFASRSLQTGLWLAALGAACLITAWIKLLVSRRRGLQD